MAHMHSFLVALQGFWAVSVTVIQGAQITLIFAIATRLLTQA